MEKLLFAGVIGMMLMQFSIATYLVDVLDGYGELLDWLLGNILRNPYSAFSGLEKLLKEINVSTEY